MSLPSLRTAVRNLSVACVACALSLNTTFADPVREKMAVCGSRDSVLPPDFIEVREKLIRSVKAEDWSYFKRLVIPGISLTSDRSRSFLDPIEGKRSEKYGWISSQRRVLEPLSDCSRYRRLIQCRSMSLADFSDLDPDSPDVVNPEGTYVRASPNKDAPPIAYFPCGSHIGRRNSDSTIEIDGTAWLQYSHRNTRGAETSKNYVELNDLRVPNGQFWGGVITFDRVGGLWRIVGYFVISS